MEVFAKLIMTVIRREDLLTREVEVDEFVSQEIKSLIDKEGGMRAVMRYSCIL